MAINKTMGLLLMDPWPYFVRLVRSQASTFQMIGRQDSRRMSFLEHAEQTIANILKGHNSLEPL
jgi:hypothetical protein